MEKASGRSISSLKADGGASASRFLMQFQSDLLDTEVLVPSVAETTAKGAAFMAGLACGFWQNIDDLPKDISDARIFSSKMDSDERQYLIKGWNKAVERVLGWEEK